MQPSTQIEAPSSPYLVVPGSEDLDLAALPTGPPPDRQGKKANRRRLERANEKLSELQRILYAHDHHSILLVFQAMDAAGKDSTIRKVFSGVNPAGCQVFSFKQPSKEELDHDYLWRTTVRLPERGRIGIFNRSYYEEVLVVRVHPDYLAGQNIPREVPLNQLWQERYESIRNFEQHLVRNGTVILKFWLNVSRDEQKQRFLSRLEEPEKHWKFSDSDLKERALWPSYMEAYRDMLLATAQPEAPWYAIPADDKPYMRATVAEIVVQSLESLDLHYPTVEAGDHARFESLKEQLREED